MEYRDHVLVGPEKLDGQFYYEIAHSGDLGDYEVLGPLADSPTEALDSAKGMIDRLISELTT